MKLQQCLQQWTDYNSSMVQCKEWLHSVEKTVKTLDLKSSFEEKQQQLQMIEVDVVNCCLKLFYTVSQKSKTLNSCP